MNFIISTENSCFLYNYKKDKITKFAPKRRAFGISWWQNRLFIAWRRPNEVVEYDQDLKPTGRSCLGTKLGKFAVWMLKIMHIL